MTATAKWNSVTPKFRAVLKKIALSLAALAIALAALRVVLNYQRPCVPPCRPLRPAGQEIKKESWGERTVYLPQQQPLELTLELDKPRARAKTRFTLHYKVSVCNLSDAEIGSVSADFFMEQKYSFLNVKPRTDFYFKVWDSSGKELEPLDDLSWRDGVIPYDLDLGILPEGGRFVTLNPGDVLTNTPSVLRPFRWEERYFESRDEYGIGTGSTKYKVPVQAKGWPAPAPGFRVLDHYLFEEPGTYRIQAVYDDVQNPDSIYPVLSALPKTLGTLLGYLSYVGIDVFPPTSSSYRDYKLHAESKVLDFEVTP